MSQSPAFATNPAMAAYSDRRTGEYDEWYTGDGLFALRDRPGWGDEVGQIVETGRQPSPPGLKLLAIG